MYLERLYGGPSIFHSIQWPNKKVTTPPPPKKKNQLTTGPNASTHVVVQDRLSKFILKFSLHYNMYKLCTSKQKQCDHVRTWDLHRFKRN